MVKHFLQYNFNLFLSDIFWNSNFFKHLLKFTSTMNQKSEYQRIVDTVNEISLIGEQKRLGRFYTEDEHLDGRIITAHNKKMIHFGSCGYMGLELDPRLKEAAIDAVRRYGTLFASSRLYASTGNYLELESLLSKLFNAHIVLTTNVSLGHHSVMPIVISKNDLVIYDQQAHISMHELAYKLRHFGTDITILRHNRLDDLEEKVIENRSKYEKIWYVIDGVYSMFGDLPQTEKIISLLDKHKKLHLYVDDAHGMSWAGKNGAGYTMSRIELHHKMVMATSIAKGFGSCGGVFLLKDLELRDRVRRWGGPLTYSGPQEPATIGAAIASAKIHLTDEIYDLQNKLQEKIAFCNYIMQEYKVPLVSISKSPIFFVGLGITKMGYNMIDRMIREGFYTNIGVFPAVPETCTGMRFTITNHIEMADIENLAKAIAHHLPKALQEEGRSVKDIFRAFRKFSDMEERIGDYYSTIALNQDYLIHLQRFKSVSEIGKEKWDSHFQGKGSFDYDQLLFLEQVFSDNELPEDNWDFFYYRVADAQDQTILLSFFTCTISKDDTLAPILVSRILEEKRKEDPYFLTSRYFMMGSLLTNGEHLYLNRTHPQWKRALVKLFDEVWLEQDKQKANVLFMRDFAMEDQELISMFQDYGFIKTEVSGNNVIEDLESISTADDFIETRLKTKQRSQIKAEVLKNRDDFEIQYGGFTEEEIELFYQYYSDVQQSALEVNTFPLPLKMFQEAAKHPNWEFFALRYKPENRWVSMGLCYKTRQDYCPTVFGMDKSVSHDLNVYKNTIYTALARGIELDAGKLFLGIGSNDSKHKFGARLIPQLGFVQLKDHFNQDYINSLKFTRE